jgi:hypothetical protein
MTGEAEKLRPPPARTSTAQRLTIDLRPQILTVVFVQKSPGGKIVDPVFFVFSAPPRPDTEQFVVFGKAFLAGRS